MNTNIINTTDKDYDLIITPFYSNGLGGIFSFYKNGIKGAELLHSLDIDINLQANYISTEDNFQYNVENQASIIDTDNEYKKGSRTFYTNFYIFGDRFSNEMVNSEFTDCESIFYNKGFQKRFFSTFGLVDKLLFLYFLNKDYDFDTNRENTILEYGYLYDTTRALLNVLVRTKKLLKKHKKSLCLELTQLFDIKPYLVDINISPYNDCDYNTYNSDIARGIFSFAYDYQYNRENMIKENNNLAENLAFFEQSLNDYFFANTVNADIFVKRNSVSRIAFVDTSYFEQDNFYLWYIGETFFSTEEKWKKALYSFIEKMKEVFNIKEQLKVLSEDNYSYYFYFYDKDHYLNNEEVLYEYLFNTNPELNLGIYIDNENNERIAEQDLYCDFNYQANDITDTNCKDYILEEIYDYILELTKEENSLNEVANLLEKDNIKKTVLEHFNNRIEYNIISY